jgi:hypothetical protein
MKCLVTMTLTAFGMIFSCPAFAQSESETVDFIFRSTKIDIGVDYSGGNTASFFTTAENTSMTLSENDCRIRMTEAHRDAYDHPVGGTILIDLNKLKPAGGNYHTDNQGLHMTIPGVQGAISFSGHFFRYNNGVGTSDNENASADHLDIDFFVYDSNLRKRIVKALEYLTSEYCPGIHSAY